MSRLNNGTVLITITGIITTSVTILGIVSLLVDANTNLQLNGKHNDTSVEVEIEKSLANIKLDNCQLRKKEDNRLICDSK